MHAIEAYVYRYQRAQYYIFLHLLKQEGTTNIYIYLRIKLKVMANIGWKIYGTVF